MFYDSFGGEGTQSTYFGPNFRKWSEFGLFPENQSEFGLNLLRNSDFFQS